MVLIFTSSSYINENILFVQGYPSIFFISAYEKFDPILFNGDRTYKGFKDWVHR